MVVHFTLNKIQIHSDSLQGSIRSDPNSSHRPQFLTSQVLCIYGSKMLPSNHWTLPCPIPSSSLLDNHITPSFLKAPKVHFHSQMTALLHIVLRKQ